MAWKKLGRALLFPHTAVLLLLLPTAAAFLLFALTCMEDGSAAAIASYVLSAYTLTVCCARAPGLVRFFRRVKTENRYVRRWFEDARMRTNVTMYGSLLWNLAYAVMQLGLGVLHSTFWYGSLAGYYLCLGAMRFYLVRYTTRYTPGERMRAELIRCRVCGWVLLAMNLALAQIVFFMVRWDRTFTHHRITTIALAAYTFTAFTLAAVNAVRYRKYKSPVLSAGKAVSLAAALVSMLTLESTMLTAFDDGAMGTAGRKLMLGATGGAVSVFIIAMAIRMIAESTKKLNAWKAEED